MFRQLRMSGGKGPLKARSAPMSSELVLHGYLHCHELLRQHKVGAFNLSRSLSTAALAAGVFIACVIGGLYQFTMCVFCGLGLVRI